VASFRLTCLVTSGNHLKRVWVQAVGAFYEERRQILQATGFLVRPDRMIAVAQYSSGPIGRLVWQDVLALVQFYKRQAARPPKS